MARGAMPDMPIYKFRMQDGKIVDYELEMELIKMKHMEIMLKDQTSKELDELLNEQDFLSEQEMKI